MGATEDYDLYRLRAEELLEIVDGGRAEGAEALEIIANAQVNATLALAAATMEVSVAMYTFPVDKLVER